MWVSVLHRPWRRRGRRKRKRRRRRRGRGKRRRRRRSKGRARRRRRRRWLGLDVLTLSFRSFCYHGYLAISCLLPFQGDTLNYICNLLVRESERESKRER